MNASKRFRMPSSSSTTKNPPLPPLILPIPLAHKKTPFVNRAPSYLLIILPSYLLILYLAPIQSNDNNPHPQKQTKGKPDPHPPPSTLCPLPFALYPTKHTHYPANHTPEQSP